MTQPAAQFQSRQLVRSVPFSTPVGLIDTVAAGATISTIFDVASALSDRNAVGPAGPLGRVGTGFLLDVSMFMDQAGTLEVLFVITGGTNTPGVFATGTARSVMTGGVPLVVAASTLTLIAGLRVIGSECVVQYKNTSVNVANAELWAAVRSV